MKFKNLATYFLKIEETSSRLAMTELLADLFKKIGADEIDKVLYLLQGRVAPLFIKVDFQLGEKMLIKGLVQALHVERELFVTTYNKIGDLGKTVEKMRKGISTIEQNEVSISYVFNELYNISQSGGAGSQDAKLAILTSLIRTLDPLSCRYVVRIPTNMLRLGFSDMTILDAFSWMLTGNKSLRQQIEKAYHVRPDLGFIGKTLKEKGMSGIKHVKPALYTPILMMKAERLSKTDEIFEKAPNGIIEPKYDGFRLQIHFEKSKVKGQMSKVKLYSRGLEDVTYMYPDVVEGVLKEVKADEIIFEGEAIGYDPNTDSFLPFQETVQRKRKYDISEYAKEIPLKLFVFELLYANGVNYLTVPFEKRRSQLKKMIKLSGNRTNDTLLLSTGVVAKSAKTIELAFDDAVSKGLEGIMVKKLDGIYQPGARGWNWIKYKRSYSSKIEDTIDCLVMGYDFGRGKRTGFGLGAFLAGVYDAKRDMFVTVAKIGTGLTDDEWRELKKRCDKKETSKMPPLYDVDKIMNADIWVKPQIVVEIRADELTRSPVHTAGRVLKKTKSGNAMEVDVAGFALRFPRLERFRDDKLTSDVTSVKEVEKLFKAQKH